MVSHLGCSNPNWFSFPIINCLCKSPVLYTGPWEHPVLWPSAAFSACVPLSSSSKWSGGPWSLSHGSYICPFCLGNPPHSLSPLSVPAPSSILTKCLWPVIRSLSPLPCRALSTALSTSCGHVCCPSPGYSSRERTSFSFSSHILVP